MLEEWVVVPQEARGRQRLAHRRPLRLPCAVQCTSFVEGSPDRSLTESVADRRLGWLNTPHREAIFGPPKLWPAIKAKVVKVDVGFLLALMLCEHGWREALPWRSSRRHNCALRRRTSRSATCRRHSGAYEHLILVR